MKIDEDAPPPDFVPYEKEPTVVKRVEPKYPDLALRAGLEGNVFVKVWVDKEGKVRKVLIMQSDNEIFNTSALEAVQQWTFTPAKILGVPVSVWISVPLHYKFGLK